MKYWIINNTKFGYKNNSKEWIKIQFDYFENFFIPFLKKYSKPNDKIIHLGNIFNHSEVISTNILMKTFDLFQTLNSILPLIILPGINDKNNINLLFNTNIDNSIKHIQNINQYNNEKLVFINNRIDTDILKKHNSLIVCGLHDERNEDVNIIKVGSLYKFDNNDDRGFYIIDSETNKYKFVKNIYSPNHNTIKITNIKQIDEIDVEFVKNNNVDIIIDKSLIDDKKIKIDVLLSKYDFKSITYITRLNDIDQFLTC